MAHNPTTSREPQSPAPSARCVCCEIIERLLISHRLSYWSHIERASRFLFWRCVVGQPQPARGGGAAKRAELGLLQAEAGRRARSAARAALGVCGDRRHGPLLEHPFGLIRRRPVGNARANADPPSHMAYAATAAAVTADRTSCGCGEGGESPPPSITMPLARRLSHLAV